MRRFKKAKCDRCHRKHDVGERFGPDLTTLGWRRQRKEMLSAILYPSHELNEEYPSVTLLTDDGRVLAGMMAAGPDETVVIVHADGRRTSVPKSEIDEIKPSRISNMPAGLLDSLSINEIQCLFDFLAESDPDAIPHHDQNRPAK